MTGAAKKSIVELEQLAARALAASGVRGDVAQSVARALLWAEIHGHSGHGLSRVASYALQVHAGKVDGRAVPTAEARRPGTLLIDACNGFAYPAIDLAVARLPDLARSAGIAIAAITRSHHLGAAGYHVERLAEQGLVALMVGNTPKAMTAWGGTRPLLGTNPIAFAAPRRDASPLLVDMALSQVARGRMVSAAQKGEAIPLGWAVDANGQPTTEPKAALAGTLLPIGGAKGAALALMVETLAVALTGASLSCEASSFFDAEGGPPNVGQVLIAIDPGGLAGRQVFLDRIEALLSDIEADGRARLPGSRGGTLAAAARQDGVRIDPHVLAEVEALASA
jgi:(2R)-3-sulfolactate dehydrogenase (NADP+)